MKNLRRSFDRFCYKNRNKGIPNLMLYICIGAGIVYLTTQFTESAIPYLLLRFDRELILQGQVWRLFTYPLTFSAGNLGFMLIALLCYYSLGRAVENVWGTFRFNLFYLTGVLLLDVYCMITGTMATADDLNLTLVLAYATLYPSARFLLFFIIPIPAWVMALFYLVISLLNVLSAPFPYNLFPIVALGNYFLFFGKDVLNLIPVSWRANTRRLFRKVKPRKKGSQESGPIIFPGAGSYEASTAQVKAPYTHRCTVCGRTDVSDPQLEFRYCSKCSGYKCYCIDHINNHPHI